MAVPGLSGAQSPTVDPTTPAARDTEPVILTGANVPGWSAAPNFTFKLPLTDLGQCAISVGDNPGSQVPINTDTDTCQHNEFAQPEGDSQQFAPQEGTPTDRLLAYRWDAAAKEFRQIPFQVDEVFTRYLGNQASGFSFYSGEDQQTTYAYDREGFRHTESDPENTCLARPSAPPTQDPVRGLDDNDELVFMAADAGPAAPSDARLPDGVESARQVEIRDPQNPQAQPGYAYVMRALPGGAKAAFDAESGYVSYERDPKADLFEFSESNYDNYGNAATGPYCDDDGNVVLKPDGQPDVKRRRPRDWATITTSRYRFHYGGRWLMDSLEISSDGGQTFAPDVLDRWKARAFAQDPGSETPCCGFEEEETNWGGSSTLLGERAGPVRAIRETWGADSGTNVARRETFYRDEFRQKTWLRVHPIPPLDGIYSQWDFNAGKMTRFFTPKRQDGLPVDGRNDEAYGNLDDPCNPHYDSTDYNDGGLTQGYRSGYREFRLCDISPYHQSVDAPDFTISDANASLAWSVTAGPHGSIVDRYQVDRVTDLTPGGTPQALLAVPYYRDDSCFDDGTGSDPGPKLRPRSDVGDEKLAPDGTQRRCWKPADGDPAGSPNFFQGSIGTHGLHILTVAESDNARLTVPLTEIVAEQRLVPLPGQRDASVGEQYGRGFEKPLLATVTDARLALPIGGLPLIPLPGGSETTGGGSTTGDGSTTGAGSTTGGSTTGGEGGAPPGEVPPTQAGAGRQTPAEAGRPRRSRLRRGRGPLRVRGISRRALSVRRGRFRVRCRVSGARLRGCLVAVKVRGRTIGSGWAAVGRARTVRVTVRLDRRGRRLVSRRRRGLRVRLVFAAMPTDGLGRSTRRSAVLRRR